MDLSELERGIRVVGVIPKGPVEVVAVERSDGDVANLIYRSEGGDLDQRLVTAADAGRFEIATERRWSFDANGGMFRLASEARRIQLTHLFDPFTAVEASGIDPLPHQIEAVYLRLLPLRPLRFLLADDPGAGKTIMSGLYIRELVLRGDLARCLIIAPGSLVEQWQEELWDKFSLGFDILSRDMVEASRTANPFLERNMLVARLDQLSRNDDLLAKLSVSEWDLVIVDEAHKMAAHLYGNEVTKTKRFQLGERLGDLTRGLLLLTATPHNGKNDDFLLFMSLLDRELFGGRLRNNARLPDTSDVMRRYVKEGLLKFDGTRLFPERIAETLNYSLSEPEQRLYDEVTEYVRTGMNRADAIIEGGDRRRGLVVGFALAGLQRRLASSPAAIHESLQRRREKVERRLAEMEGFAGMAAPVPRSDSPAGNRTSVSHRSTTLHAVRILPGHQHFSHFGCFIRFRTVLYNPSVKLITKPIPRTGNNRKHETTSDALGHVRQDCAAPRTLRRRTGQPRANSTSQTDENRESALEDMEPADQDQREGNQSRPRFLPSCHTHRGPPPGPQEPPSPRRGPQPESRQDTNV